MNTNKFLAQSYITRCLCLVQGTTKIKFHQLQTSQKTSKCTSKLSSKIIKLKSKIFYFIEIGIKNQNVDGNAPKENNKGGNFNFLFNLG
jgi:hypothetical protein